MPLLYFLVLLSAIGAILVSPIQVFSPATIALFSTISWWGFDQWYVKQDLAFIQPFLVHRGHEIPAFLLQDVQGRDVPSDSLFLQPLADGDPPAHLVVVFFRGNWCGVCMAQLERFRQQAPSFASRHVRIVLVSTQPLENQQQLAATVDKFDNVTVLHDPDHRVTRAWGLLAVGQTPVSLTNYPPDAAIPATLLISNNWRMQASWLSRDYRSRATPKQVLTALG
jgi:peroxiredoxin